VADAEASEFDAQIVHLIRPFEIVFDQHECVFTRSP
jgi:hypothetical protein